MTHKLSRCATSAGPRWTLDGRPLVTSFTLAELLRQPADAIADWLAQQQDAAAGDIQIQAALPPIEPLQEVWASGVTYLRSRDARKAESSVADVYQKVYEAERPELFMKAIGWRVVTGGQPVRIRKDSRWNVPEPELTLVINAHGEIVGYTAGNDMSSRDIEGENPLYLPQAKIYTGACALGPEIVLADVEAMRALPVTLEIRRDGAVVFSGETNIARMKRRLEELVSYLYRELAFPDGAFLMTGTGIVPPESFSLQRGDRVKISVGEVTLENDVA
ncbi:MAG: fumarylacetoacetate hydrolase family protein [Thermoflexales bacterium]